LNAVVPGDVRVASAEEAAPEFHARFSATGKVYDYRIVTGPYISPFVLRYAWHMYPPLDVEAMKRAAELLIGEHDFSTFRGAGSEAHTSVRTITRIAWSGGSGPADPLTIRFEGTGFLRHMVRSIAGTLVEIGLGRWPPGAMQEILESRDRTRAGKTAPAHGLFLVEVKY
jgi:tRNA pseudouridine38-40 synthase